VIVPLVSPAKTRGGQHDKQKKISLVSFPLVVARSISFVLCPTSPA